MLFNPRVLITTFITRDKLVAMQVINFQMMTITEDAVIKLIDQNY